MSNKNLQELVKIARGERTKRKYAEESGVNVAIISRIESGDYMPGKKVLEKLTSPNARPQGGITYADLVEAASDNKQFQKGLAAGMLATPLGFIGIPFLTAAFAGGTALGKGMELLFETSEQSREKSISRKREKEFLDEMKYFALGMERYKATATGVIFAKLAEMGITCRPGKQEDTDFPLNYTDLVMLIEDNNISTWVLSCVTLNEENRDREAFIKLFAARFIDKLLHTKPDPKKKASFVVDDEGLYKYLLEMKGKNSYRGNLSIIQFDAKSLSLVREEYISRFDLYDTENKLLLVK